MSISSQSLKILCNNFHVLHICVLPHLLQKTGEAHHHHYPKSKHDNLDNQIMRAFLKSVGRRYKVANGEEALQMLRKSGQIRRDLNQLKPFCGIEGVQFSMSVTKWDSQIPQYPGMDLRGFVYGVSHLWFS